MALGKSTRPVKHGSEAEQALHEHGENKQRSIETVAHNECEHCGNGQVFASREHAEVHRRVFCMQFPPHKGGEGYNGDEGEEGDVGGCEPVFLTAPVQE